ncbi:FACT complex subunit [Entophlyctis luteolus]|nr:FACT complex subunit [Entophlyctis luteolus]
MGAQDTFDNIFTGGKNGAQTMGKFKLTEAGIGFKEAISEKVLTMRAQDIRRAVWLRCARDFELRIELSSGQVHKFDGFPRDAFERISEIMQVNYSVTLDAKDISTRGYNWGKTEFNGSYLSFNVGSKPSFEIPLADVANTAPVGKNDVSIEFVQPVVDKDKPRVREDTLVEIHFHVPGMAVQSQVDTSMAPSVLSNSGSTAPREGHEEGEIDEAPVFGDDGEALTAAALFCDTIKTRAHVGVTQSESLVSFNDVLCLLPRGRFEVDMFATFFRIRGKSNDYRILFSSIKRMFLLPKPDDLHTMFVVQLDPPLRQGLVTHSFLVFQFDIDEEFDATIKLDEETLETQYQNRLRKEYDGQFFVVVSEIFKGLSGVNIISPGLSFKSTQGYSGVKCALKTFESFLYPLEKSFISVPKPAILIPHSDVSHITFLRVHGASSSTKTIEMKITTAAGVEHTYTSISREEYQGLAQYCRTKKLHIATELEDGAGGAGGLSDGDGDEEIDGGAGGKKRKRAVDLRDPLNGDLADESESDDEDFEDKESGSDVDLEYDTEATGSDSSDEDDSAESDGNASAEEAPKKQVKKEFKGDGVKKKKAERPREGDAKKVKKDPNAPKGAQSSYIIFSNEVRDKVRAENPSLSLTETSKKIGAMWKELSADEKKKYEDLAAKDKKRVRAEMAEYEKKKSGKSTSAGTAGVSSKKSAEFVDDDD